MERHEVWGRQGILEGQSHMWRARTRQGWGKVPGGTEIRDLLGKGTVWWEAKGAAPRGLEFLGLRRERRELLERSGAPGMAGEGQVSRQRGVAGFLLRSPQQGKAEGRSRRMLLVEAAGPVG